MPIAAVPISAMVTLLVVLVAMLGPMSLVVVCSVRERYGMSAPVAGTVTAIDIFHAENRVAAATVVLGGLETVGEERKQTAAASIRG